MAEALPRPDLSKIARQQVALEEWEKAAQAQACHLRRVRTSRLGVSAFANAILVSPTSFS